MLQFMSFKTEDELLQSILHAEQTYARNRRFWKD